MSLLHRLRLRAAAMINGTLGQDVAGFGGCGMWNGHLYFANTLYRSEHIGGSQPNDDTAFGFSIRGIAPYWRLAYQTSCTNNEFEVGTYGMHMKSSPAWKTATPVGLPISINDPPEDVHRGHGFLTEEVTLCGLQSGLSQYRESC